MTQSMMSDGSSTKRSLPIAGRKNETLDVDAELARFEAEERARLGLAQEEQWVEKMANLMFTKKEKGKITLLIGGLTMAHDYLISGAFRSLGYNVVPLDAPDYEALRAGKEFGNRGQCNPTYFTVGNLIKFLIHVRDKGGLTSQEVVENFVFLTAGACGPCRFGMYVTEYRKALRDAGFDGFRVMLFQQQGGLSQATGEESGLELNPPFFIGLLKGLLAGDVINGIAYRLRPYEVVPGSTDAAVAEAKKICYDALYEKRSILRALHQSRKIFEKVEVDRTIPKPKVAIIGEFWAMTTEGDGNYQLQRFLEAEGAECDIQFVTAWLLYNVWEVRFDTKNRTLLRGKDHGKLGLAGTSDFHAFKMKASLWAADKAIRVAFQTFANVGGFYDYHLPDMDEVADVAAPFYNNDLRGGEGHMEVGKLILNVVKSKATMTLSVKPFGCMPSSSVSDGVQSLITERYPGTIYCAVETSGDGAVNFQSRVQMYLFKARQAAVEDFERALEKTGLTLEKLRAFLKANPKYAAGLHKSPHYAGSTPADLVHEVAEVVDLTPAKRTLFLAQKKAKGVLDALTNAAKDAPANTRSAAVLFAQAAAELAEIAKEKAPGMAESAVNAARDRLAKVLPFTAQRPVHEPVVAAAE
ncbi:MAG TPA: 2-hydroxyglutaryl-CoA dehydratase [Polyangiaceae bacterium]|nr:2-hydroxyglutaryl-CoA dehydratase [Polyangiaceae bacterium]